MKDGTVKWYDRKKGYGFISSSDGDDIFVHYTSLSSQTTTLADGDTVKFEIVDGEKGPRASNVTVQV
ncbi:MAG: cold shock domain-containing protein [Anaerohalosphaera sp.]|nr:cold shock domain-containing protein [Anaerohalosphaera sp.]